jgi:hypothetical protein
MLMANVEATHIGKGSKGSFPMHVPVTSETEHRPHAFGMKSAGSHFVNSSFDQCACLPCCAVSQQPSGQYLRRYLAKINIMHRNSPHHII